MSFSQKRDLYQSTYSMDEDEFPLLEPYNPAKKDLSNQKPFDFFRSWQFFEQVDSFWISSKVVGRQDVCPATNSTHVYLGRQIQSGKPTIVSWPLSEAREVSNFVRTFLQDSKSRTFRDVTFGLSALRGKEPRTYNWGGDRVRFWSKPDLDLGTLLFGADPLFPAMMSSIKSCGSGDVGENIVPMFLPTVLCWDDLIPFISIGTFKNSALGHFPNEIHALFAVSPQLSGAGLTLSRVSARVKLFG